MAESRVTHKHRVLICTPFGRDAELSAAVLKGADIEFHICTTIEDAVFELGKGGAALLTVEELVLPGRSIGLAEFVAAQPRWSDFPILVLTKPSAEKAWLKEAYERLRNLTLLEIPIRPPTLVSVVRAATRARERQYEIEAADRSKDEFLAMLGHELRNPLAPIGAAAQLLSLAPANLSKVKMASEIVARQVKHMTSLIDDLLDVARVTRGLITLDRQQIDLRTVISSALEQVEPSAMERGHDLHHSFPSREVCVLGDAKRLVQIFVNVLQNSVKYTPNGGQIELSLRSIGGFAHIEVKDNGIGISPNVVPYIFDLFAQAERSSDRSQGGLGLGLSLVKSLVASHGGNIRVESDGIGKGSQFTITLPIVENVRGELCSASSGTSGQRADQMSTLLIVDDNRDAANTLAMLLDAMGYEANTRYSAYDALAFATLNKPQICLLDIGLPDMDGNELAARLRGLPETANTILIAVTGYGQSEDREKSLAAGFDEHLIKPVDIEGLLKVIYGLKNRGNSAVS